MRKIKNLYQYISKRCISKYMFEKIAAKIRFGSCKTKVIETIDKDKTSEKKKPEEKVK